jgi:hypothetical protein
MCRIFGVQQDACNKEARQDKKEINAYPSHPGKLQIKSIGAIEMFGNIVSEMEDDDE